MTLATVLPSIIGLRTHIPPKVRTSQYDKTPARPSGGGSHRDYANKYKNEKESGGGGYSAADYNLASMG